MYDVVVIGSGPGGYVAAIRAAQLGLKTACVEKEALGGTCLNVGCIPSKTLLQATSHYHFLKHDAKVHGIEYKDLSFNFDTMMGRKDEVVQSFNQGIAYLFKKNKVESIQGHGSFVGSNCIRVGHQEVEAKNIIIATGSQPISLPFLPIDERKVLTSTGALSLPEVPGKMVVIGGGVIGVELASVYSRLGSEVTVVEMLDRIVPTMDPSISKGLRKVLENQGIEFMLPAKVESADIGETVTLTVDGKALSSDVVLVAVGRRPYVDNLGLDQVGISLGPGGFIPTDANFRADTSHIYAIGDVTQGPMLAHKASEEGVAVAELIAGLRPHVNHMAVPNVVYTHPEAAGVGLTEPEAKEAGLEIKVGQFPFKGNSRARCVGEDEGFVKCIREKESGRLVGMHILGACAGELIQEGMLAIEKRATVEDLAAAPHAHPTLSEAIKEASLGVFDRPIHI